MSFKSNKKERGLDLLFLKNLKNWLLIPLLLNLKNKESRNQAPRKSSSKKVSLSRSWSLSAICPSNLRSK
jgi:hypothetical protein